MAEFSEGLLGASWHRAEDGTLGVVPAKIDTNVLASLVVEADFVEFLESGHEVINIFLALVLDTMGLKVDMCYLRFKVDVCCL